MWSFGCIVAELYSGFPLFPGENEVDQLSYIMEICGEPPAKVLDLSSRRHLFFENDNKPIAASNSRGKERQPGHKSLEKVLKCSDSKFIDFLKQCFMWHPFDRITPLQALQHEWILEGLPDKVLQHHKKMFNTPEDILSLQQATLTDIQGFPPHAQAQSIYEIVEEVKNDDLQRDIRRQ
jgi:dual specificity tyrosine-phosphorylation-regulated kinase 2/3/4